MDYNEEYLLQKACNVPSQTSLMVKKNKSKSSNNKNTSEFKTLNFLQLFFSNKNFSELQKGAYSNTEL